MKVNRMSQQQFADEASRIIAEVSIGTRDYRMSRKQRVRWNSEHGAEPVPGGFIVRTVSTHERVARTENHARYRQITRRTLDLIERGF